jgi:hypothetical protein
VAAIALALVAFPATAGAASWTPTAITLPPGATEGGLGGVSCPAAGLCVAVGASGPNAIVATETAGVWGQAIAIAPPSLPNASLAGVSCPAVGECIAVGAQFQLGLAGAVQPIAATETGGVWGPAVALGLPAGVVNSGLSGVSCPTVGDCVAVGGGEGGLVAVTDSGGTWEPAVAVALPPGAFTGNDLVSVPQLQGVSCTAVGNCVAVGDWEKSSSVRQRLPMEATETGGTWSQAAGLALPAGDVEGWLQGVSCADASSCVAVGASSAGYGDLQPLGATVAGGNWTQTLIAPPAGATGADLSGISCPAAGSCTAVGIEGALVYGPPIAVAYVDGAWSQAVSIVPSGSSPQGGLGGVSCPGVGPCVTAGASEGQPIVYTGQGAEAEQGGGSSSVQVTTIDSPGGGGGGGGGGPTGPTATCSISLASTSIRVDRAHTAQVGLTDSGGAACDGHVSLVIPIKAKGKKAKSKRSKGRTIAITSLALAPGQTATVPVKLNGAGRKALAGAHGALKASLTVEAGKAQQIVESVRLRQTSRKHSRKQSGRGRDRRAGGNAVDQ